MNTLFRLSGREPRLRSFSRANTASHPSIQLIDWICFFSPLLSFQKGNSLLRDMLRVKRRASGCRPMLTPTVKGHTSSQSLRLNNKHTHTHSLTPHIFVRVIHPVGLRENFKKKNRDLNYLFLFLFFKRHLI